MDERRHRQCGRFRSGRPAAHLGAANCCAAPVSLRPRAPTPLSPREAHVKSILDTIPDAMIVIDERGLMQSFSAAAERLFGYAAAEVLGQNVKMLMPSPYRDDHDGYIGRYLAHRRAAHHRHRPGGRRRAQGRVDLSAGAERRRGAGPAISRFFTGFIRDLTERQKTEARLQELQSELVHVSRLTAMGEMASALAHELNQPLSAIANYMKGSRRLLEDSSDERAAILREAMDKAARTGAAGRASHPPLARLRRPRRERTAGRRRAQACRGSERAGVGRRQGQGRARPFRFRSAQPISCWPTRCRFSRLFSI